ncbi:MAG TPA: hypothetical protein VNT60_01930 [Deinococcales bacterium]|nr:hypothetical protein [Deinococcales bacterium]
MKLETTSARAFGLARIAIGTVGMISPRTVARFFGAQEEPKALVYGMAARDLVIGAGLLFSRNPSGWLVLASLADAADVGLVASNREPVPVFRRLTGMAGAGFASVSQSWLARRTR